MFQNTIKYKNADMFHNTIVKQNAAKFLSIMMYNIANHAKNGFATKNAVMYANTTTNTFAVTTTVLHQAQQVEQLVQVDADQTDAQLGINRLVANALKRPDISGLFFIFFCF